MSLKKFFLSSKKSFKKKERSLFQKASKAIVNMFNNGSFREETCKTIEDDYKKGVKKIYKVVN